MRHNTDGSRESIRHRERTVIKSFNNSYKIIDTSNWKRKLHCEIFRNAFQPYFSVSLELDITNFLKKVKENKWLFSLAFIHTITRCANDIEEFRYRFLKGEISKGIYHWASSK